MKIANIILIAVMALLSIAAGLAKVMQVPKEMAFLTGLGLDNTMIFIFGAIQIVGGILLAIPKSKMYGSVLVVIAFLVSAILVFVGGNFTFGIVSMLPVLITGFIVYQTLKNTHNKAMHATGAL